MKEIIKSIPMMLFVVFVLGLITIVSYFDAKKDLPRTTETSQIVITNK